MEWFKKHGETIVVILTILGTFFWTDTKMDTKFEKVNDRLSRVETDIAVIKTVLSLKGINCPDLTKQEELKK